MSVMSDISNEASVSVGDRVSGYNYCIALDAPVRRRIYVGRRQAAAFDELRQRAQHTTLTAEEQRMLDLLLLDLEQAEWAALRPALSRLRSEQEDLRVDLGQVQARNAVLISLAERYDVLTQLARLLEP